VLSRFFIDRPIFASVLSIVIVIGGLISLRNLPVSQYPEIAPPTIQVIAYYPGASASVIADTVAQVIEEQVNGIEDMLYMASTSTNTGAYTLTVTFDVGVDLDDALVQVQNRVAQAEPLLPEEVQRLGLTTQKMSTNVLMFATLISPDERFDPLFLGNYASLRVRDELARVKGVGDVQVFGAGNYSMRVWLDARKMEARGLTTTEVIGAIRSQNSQVAAGQIGQTPAPSGQEFQLALNVEGRLGEVKEFEEIVVRAEPGGRVLYLRDIARIELGAANYETMALRKGVNAAAIGVFLQPGANALETGELIRGRMDALKENFPEGLDFAIPFDTTVFVESSIQELATTLLIAVGLVFLTILVFLQDWRATLIPAATIPVSLIGTFALMSTFGLSINMLSLFGLILAIGIVVDDAIVVVEKTVRKMDEEGLDRKEAARQAMDQVTGPIIATSLVLLVVFVPTAYLGGITGELFRQFALTIAIATVFSTINALTLSPALSGLLLRPTKPQHATGIGRLWHRLFGTAERSYQGSVGWMIRHRVVSILLFGAIAGSAVWGLGKLPTGFVPEEDLGWALVAIQLPDAATEERMLAVVDQVNAAFARIDGLEDWVAVPGFSLLDNGVSANAATCWVSFESWDKRLPKGLTQEALIGQLWMAFAGIQEAQIFAITPPPIMGIGAAGGFQLQVKDLRHGSLTELEAATWKLAMAANQNKNLNQVFTTFRASVPQLDIDIDREHARMLEVPIQAINETLQANFGSVYVNDFNKFGRVYQVRVQADSAFRADPEQIGRLRVRNAHGEMVPLASLVDINTIVGPQIIPRYNMSPSAALNGNTVHGVSSGKGLETMEHLAAQLLPPNMEVEWTGMSYQEKAGEGKAGMLYALAILMVYLILAAQYESWALPFTVILSVPLALLGTVIGIAARSMDVNSYTQIGIVLLIALASKTAIMIAEFARYERSEGMSLIDSALEAARLRFRPILMTAFTFILGVFPLVIATGAGAASRQALGTAVFSGMISATILLVVFVPVFYVVIQGAADWVGNRMGSRRTEPEPARAPA